MAPGRAASTSRTSPAAGGAGPPGRLEGWVDRLEHGRWRVPDARRAGVVGAAAATTGLLVGLSMGARLGLRVALLVAMLTGWRLRFRPSAAARVWRRQAAAQRHTAGMLAALEQDGYPVLHDVTLPGWPASLDHLAGSRAAVRARVDAARGRPVGTRAPGGDPAPARRRGPRRAAAATRGGPAGHRRRPGGPPPGHVAAGHGRKLRASRHRRMLRHHPQGVTAPARRRSHRADAFRS
jgi:hypothetical protein